MRMRKMRNFRFLKVIALLTMVAMMLTATVSAAVIDRAVYNVNTDTITVSGNMQGVDRTLLSENGLLNSDCSSVTTADDVAVWETRGSAIGSSFEIVEESDGNRYIKLKDRPSKYTGIRQSIRNILDKNGKGTYRISGRIKAEDKTVGETTIVKGDVKVNVFTKNKQYYTTVKDVTNEWVSFSVDFDISSYGYTASGGTEELDYWADGSNATTNTVYFETSSGKDSTGKVTVDDTRDLCIDDIKMQYVGEKEIYEGAETARLRIANAVTGDTVYVNEFDTAEDGSYKVSLQLPDSVVESTTPLIAYVSGINTEEPASRNIEVKDVRAKTSTEYRDGKAYVSFEIFDLLDSSGYGDLIAVAASYTADNRLYKAAMSTVKIDLDTDVKQTIEIDMPTDENGEIADGCHIKLMFVENMTTLSPLCKMLVDEKGAQAELILVGDSIVVGYANREAEGYNYYPQRGWGECIGDYFNNNITVNNCAHGGFSTSTFMDPDTFHGGYGNAHAWNSNTLACKNNAGEIKLWATTPILPQIDEGDYVMICLGINDDSSGSEKNVYTDETTYKANLKQMYEDADDKGAEVIFISPTTYSAMTGGVYTNRWSERGDWMEEVATECGAVFLDLGEAMTNHYNKVGEETVKTYHLFQDVLKKPVAEGGFGLTEEDILKHANGVISGKSTSTGKPSDDKTHVSTKGAEMVSRLIVDLLEKSDSSLKNHIAK